MKNIDINMNNIDFIKIERVGLHYRIRNKVYPHRHNKMEMHFITSGHGFMEVEEELLSFGENSFIITFPEDVHRLIPAEDCIFISQYTVFFDYTGDIEILRCNFKHGIKNIKGTSVFQEVERHWNSGDDLLMASAGHRLTAFILELLSEERKVLSNSYIENAQDYMRRHVAEKVSLDKLCRYVGLEKSYFCRLFKQISGDTPMYYFIRQKIELSKEMLSAGERNSDIASATGFADEFHFSRTFKKITGISPRQYKDR